MEEIIDQTKRERVVVDVKRVRHDRVELNGGKHGHQITQRLPTRRAAYGEAAAATA